MTQAKVIVLQEGTAIRWQDLTIRPTVLGMGMLAIAVACWFVALNYAVNLAYALAFWIFAFALWAMMQVILQIYGLKIKLLKTNECFVGEDARIYLYFDSLRKRQRYFLVRFLSQNNIIKTENKTMWQVFHTETVDKEFFLSFPVLKRGLITVPVIQLYSHAPFALLSVWVSIKMPWNIIVYPAPKVHQVPLGSVDQAEGLQKQVQGGEDMAYLSDYVLGESLKQIAWKQFAKTGTLLSKRFEDSVAISPEFISYQDYIHQAVSIDELASLLCYRVLLAEQLQQRYILILPREIIAPQNQQRERALHALSLLS